MIILLMMLLFMIPMVLMMTMTMMMMMMMIKVIMMLMMMVMMMMFIEVGTGRYLYGQDSMHGLASFEFPVQTNWHLTKIYLAIYQYILYILFTLCAKSGLDDQTGLASLSHQTFNLALYFLAVFLTFLIYFFMVGNHY